MKHSARGGTRVLEALLSVGPAFHQWGIQITVRKLLLWRNEKLIQSSGIISLLWVSTETNLFSQLVYPKPFETRFLTPYQGGNACKILRHLTDCFHSFLLKNQNQNQTTTKTHLWQKTPQHWTIVTSLINCLFAFLHCCPENEFQTNLEPP